MIQMLQEQQDSYLLCTSKFDRGLLVAFAVYHALYAAYFMHGLVTWAAFENH